MLKRFFITFLISCCLFLFINQTQAQTFSDVYTDHPYYNAIESLAEQGILNGYPDKTFKAENAINRVEMLKVLLLGSDVTVEESTDTAGFPDVISNSWYAKYVVKGKEKGIVRGNPNGYFYPNNQVNFAEALKMLVLANNVLVNQNLVVDPFADVPKDSWYAPYFEYAKSVNIIKKTSDEFANPGKPIDRGEAAQLIFLFQEAQTITKENPIATYYADMFEGRTTASGEIFKQEKLTAAHKTLPFGTVVKVTNLENSESVIVTINDRGPFASNPNYVIDLSKSAFQSISPLSRGIIEIEYEIINPEKEKEESEIEIKPTVSENKTTVIKAEDDEKDDLSTCLITYTKKPIKNDFFENVILDNEIPNIFQKNEVYNFSGSVDDTNTESVTIFLFNADNREEEYRFNSKVINQRFNVQVTFSEIGNFNIGILKGDAGQSFITEINVISNQCLQDFELDSIQPTNLEINYTSDQTIISWDNAGQSLSAVEIKQGNNMNQYIINNKQNSFSIPYKDFENFSQGEVFYNVSGAQSLTDFSIDQSTNWSKSETKSFQAVKHHHDFNVYKNIEINSLPETYTFGESIYIKGKSQHALNKNASIILPSGLILNQEIIPLNSANITNNTINPNSTFELNFKPNLKGTYIIEVNRADGFAVINIPIYEDGVLPLLPDIWDTREHLLNLDSSNFNVEESKEKLLEKISKSRQEFGAKAIDMEVALNQLAQGRAEDMATNNYLSHQNLQGQYVNDLKINYGIKSNIGENISKDTSIDFTHAGLMRSAVHRENILNQKWTNVGLGIAIDKEGYIVTAELFSEDELSEKDIPNLRSQFLATINQKRAVALLSDETLDSVAQEWSERMQNRADVLFEDPDTGLSLSYLITSNINAGKKNATAILKGALEPILEEIDGNETALDSQWKRLGTGITQNNDGSLNIVMIYTD